MNIYIYISVRQFQDEIESSDFYSGNESLYLHGRYVPLTNRVNQNRVHRERGYILALGENHSYWNYFQDQIKTVYILKEKLLFLSTLALF